MAALLAAPYVELPPAVRTLLFYAGDFEPAMPDYDNESLANPFPRAGFTYTMGVLTGAIPSRSAAVRGPVLLVFGEHDATMPVSLVSSEPATYPNASSVTTHVVLDTGHDLNLHLTNTDEWARMKSWIRENVDGGAGDDAD